MKNIIKLILVSFLFFVVNFSILYADILKKIEIIGNERVSDETIKLFSNISLNQKIEENDLNEILKKLYDTNFFNDVNLNFVKNTLTIKVKENPIIENINYEGISSKRILDVLKEDTLIKSRYSFNDIILKKEKKRLINILEELGYFRPKVQFFVEEEVNNLINITVDFKLGSKAKIKTITFVGNKIFKDRKLRRVIASEI